MNYFKLYTIKYNRLNISFKKFFEEQNRISYFIGCVYLTFMILISLGFTTKSFNEKDKKVLVKLNELHQYYIQHPNYSVDIKHTLFSSAMQGASIEETFNGFYKTNGILEHSDLMGFMTIQNDKIRMVLDTQSKIIKISNTNITQPFSTETIKNSLKMCKNYSLKRIDSIDLITLEFDTINYPLRKLSIGILNNRVMSIDMFHNETIEGLDNKKKYPHTRIDFFNYNEKYKLKKKDVSLDKFLINKNNKWELNTQYSDYKLYDLRNQN